jgi:hypothetical protein
VHLISSASHNYYLMPRPRARPWRGSPWKPRRPSVLLPNSPSIFSSPPLQSEIFFASSHASLNSQFNCLTIIPGITSSLSCLFLDPPTDFTTPTPVLEPLRNSDGEPPPHRRPGKARYQFTDSFNSTQFIDNLSIHHGLVFELR